MQIRGERRAVLKLQEPSQRRPGTKAHHIRSKPVPNPPEDIDTERNDLNARDAGFTSTDVPDPKIHMYP